jgi:uncharacterized membrane protein YdjX (TVP38/TMEM64 family)
MLRALMLNALIHFLEKLQLSLDQFGGWAVLAFAGIFLVAQLFLVPVAPFAIAAGFFFGFGRGWLAVMLGCLLGATVNFWISRRLARGWVQRKFGANPKFRVIDRAIEREGWRIVVLLRFVPIPFGFANYSYGLTGIHFVPYVLASFCGVIPANSLLVWIGATSQGELANVLGKGRPRHPLEYVLLLVGLIAAILVLRHITKIARAAVARGDTTEAGA